MTVGNKSKIAVGQFDARCFKGYNYFNDPAKLFSNLNF